MYIITFANYNHNDAFQSNFNYIIIIKDLSIPRFRDSAKNRVIRFPPRNHEISVENREFRNFHGKSWIFIKFC